MANKPFQPTSRGPRQHEGSDNLDHGDGLEAPVFRRPSPSSRHLNGGDRFRFSTPSPDRLSHRTKRKRFESNHEAYTPVTAQPTPSPTRVPQSSTRSLGPPQRVLYGPGLSSRHSTRAAGSAHEHRLSPELNQDSAPTNPRIPPPQQPYRPPQRCGLRTVDVPQGQTQPTERKFLERSEIIKRQQELSAALQFTKPGNFGRLLGTRKALPIANPNESRQNRSGANSRHGPVPSRRNGQTIGRHSRQGLVRENSPTHETNSLPPVKKRIPGTPPPRDVFELQSQARNTEKRPDSGNHQDALSSEVLCVDASEGPQRATQRPTESVALSALKTHKASKTQGSKKRARKRCNAHLRSELPPDDALSVKPAPGQEVRTRRLVVPKLKNARHEDLAEDIPENVHEDRAEEVPENMHEDRAEEVPENVHEDRAEEVPKNVHEDRAEEVPENERERQPERKRRLEPSKDTVNVDEEDPSVADDTNEAPWMSFKHWRSSSCDKSRISKILEAHVREQRPVLSLSYCGIRDSDLLQVMGEHSFPAGCTTLTKLTLNNNQLVSVQRPLCEKFAAFNVGDLNLMCNRLSLFESSISMCKKLRVLDLSWNVLGSIPKGICELSNLEVLNLSNNDLRALPAGFALLKKLEILNVSKNHLTTLPSDWVEEGCTLATLDVSCNKEFESFPKCAQHLTKLVDLQFAETKFASMLFKADRKLSPAAMVRLVAGLDAKSLAERKPAGRTRASKESLLDEVQALG